ncbi:MAG: hypothetical protein ACK5U7_03265 [Bacteroidota bacterium]|jgi:hypothetical protein
MAQQTKMVWTRHSWADRYQLVCGEYRILAIALGHDEHRSFYVLYHGTVRIDEFDRLAEAKQAAEMDAEEQFRSWIHGARCRVEAIKADLDKVLAEFDKIGGSIK